VVYLKVGRTLLPVACQLDIHHPVISNSTVRNICS
jgi:hypothetical protein